MPRIRKQTSNRGTTHQRSKIGQKASETRKKTRRATKKDVTWKSKKTKDIGIPNSFPYKAEVLAEIAAQRQLNEEEKIRMKEERRASYKAANIPEPVLQEDEEDDPLGVNTLAGTRVKSKASKAAPVNDDDENSDAEMEVEEEDDEEVSGAPLLFDSELPTLQAALEKADVLLEVVDARDPLGFRSPWLEELFVGEDEDGKKGKVVIVLTKIDLVPRESLQQWLLFLRPRFITILFKSRLPVTHNLGPTPKTIKNAPKFPLPLSAAKKAEEEDRRMRLSHAEACGREELLEVLERWAGEKKAAGSEEEFVVVVAGLPNVGKSSVLNTLLQSTHFPIASYPPTSLQSKVTTTTPAGTVYTSPSSSTQIKFVDTPGWIFADVFPGDDDEEEEDEEDEEKSETEEEAEMWDVIEGNRVRDLLRRNLGRVDRIKEPIPLAEYIIAHASTSDLMLLYSTPAFLATSPASFLTSLARVQGRLKKHGVPDLDAAARIVLRDWSLSQFPYYTLPAKGATLSPRVPAEVETLSLFAGAKEEKILARVRTRREMITEKGGRGVVKMKVDEVFEGLGDKREVVLDDELRQEGEDDSEGSEDGEDWEDDEDEEDEDMEIEGEEVFAEDDGEEPIDSEVEDDDAPEDATLPSMLDLITAAASSSKSSSKKRSAPPPPASTSRPSKKTAVASSSSKSTPVAAAPSPAAVASAKKVAFASQPKGKTPRGNGVVDEETPPVSILKTKAATASSSSSKKGGKKAAAVVAVAAPLPPVLSPAIGADAVELKKSGGEGRKEKKKVETKEKKEKKEKHGKIAAAAPAAASAPAVVEKAKKVEKTSSKASDRAKSDKGEVGYDFNAHFF